MLSIIQQLKKMLQNFKRLCVYIRLVLQTESA